MNRRELLQTAAASATTLALAAGPSKAATSARWIATTENKPWQDLSAQMAWSETATPDLSVVPETQYQTMTGFGGCFNEAGAKALSALKPADRGAVMDALFSRDGANLSVCRLPIGANDYALDWYSYDETDGDFAMARFSVARDEKWLIPYIRDAQTRRPDLKLWASPWSPPTWMKTNRHYAMAPSNPSQPPNGLRPDQVGHEGQDSFIQDPRYFAAYALYFRKFVDAYRGHGLPIAMVMPQNEFNSAQNFPSCCWTPQGLARFIPYLGKALEGSGTEIVFGTMERADPALFETVFTDPAAGPYIKGVGTQWAGKGAVPFIHHDHPSLPVYQSEQECGDGKNDWRYARYVWTLMKLYLGNGATVYDYWNMVLTEGGVSTWGWRQNSMVVVDAATGGYRFTPEYHLFRHMSRYVQAGAVRIAAVSWTGYDNALAFRNPDGSTVVLMQNDGVHDLPVTIGHGARRLQVTLPADSFNTFVV